MEHQSHSISLPGLLKTLSVLYFSFLGSQLLFALVAFLKQSTTYFEFENSEDVFIYAVPVLAVAAFVASMLVYREQISTLTDKGSLPEKFSGYQSAYLVRMAFLEAASIFGIIAFMLKGNLFSLVFTGLLILYFLTLKPSKDKVEADLDLSE